VKKRFGHTPEENTDTHTGAEKHGKPCSAIEIRNCIAPTQTNRPSTGKGEIEDSKKKHTDNKNQKLHEIRRYPVLYIGKKSFSRLPDQQNGSDKDDQQYKRRPENRRVDVKKSVSSSRFSLSHRLLFLVASDYCIYPSTAVEVNKQP
jgi:hypothetical protein